MASSNTAALKGPYWKPVSKTHNYIIQGTDIRFAFNNLNAAGAIVLTLPKAGNASHTQAGGPGLQYSFLVATGQQITVTPNLGDTIRGKAVNVSAVNAIVGNYLQLICIVPGFWEPIINNGAW